MNKETIEKEAKARCVTERMDEWKKDFGISCFMDGAEWRINSVWHDDQEMPSSKRDFIYQSILKSGKVCLGMRMKMLSEMMNGTI